MSSYEINVSLNGRHFFVTAERSIRDPQELQRVYKALTAAFKAADGYDFTVVEIVKYQKEVPMLVDAETQALEALASEVSDLVKTELSQGKKWPQG